MLVKVVNHFRAHKSFYTKVAVASAIFLLIPDTALAAGTVDDGGMRAYKKIFSVGKWIIIGKWALDSIQCALNGDYDGIKQKSIAYAACVALINLDT